MNPNEDIFTPEERHAFEHPEDHANVSKPAEAEECCGGHCGCDHAAPDAGKSAHDWCMPDCGQHEVIEPWSPKPYYDSKGRRQNDIHHNTPFKPLKNELKGLGRNTPCRCGSGKKYKKCCIHIIEDNN